MGLISVTGPLVIKFFSSNRAADLLAAFATEERLDVPDGSPMSLHVLVDTVGDKSSYNHQDDEEGKDDQAHIQAGTKCLMEY